MSNAPERIWLQDHGEWSDEAYIAGEITWCDIEINEGDTEYRRADIAPNLSEALAVPEVANLVEALQTIRQWSDSYPDSVFPEPDFKRAATVLARAGLTLDAISASNMRHATSGVGELARTALAAIEKDRD